MKTALIISLIVIYLLIAFISVRPFRILNNQGHLDHPNFAAILWPIMWAILTIAIIIAEYIELFKEPNK